MRLAEVPGGRVVEELQSGNIMKDVEVAQCLESVDFLRATEKVEVVDSALLIGSQATALICCFHRPRNHSRVH